jgi:hypothetical protein
MWCGKVICYGFKNLHKMQKTITKNLLLLFNPFRGLEIDLKNDHSSWKIAYLNEKTTLRN